MIFFKDGTGETAKVFTEFHATLTIRRERGGGLKKRVKFFFSPFKVDCAEDLSLINRK